MDLNILFFVLVGFVAQMIDGALGMAYGVSSNTFLLSIGIPPASASASVHLAECVTTAVSGLSHWKQGNINWYLIKRLIIPGVLGGILGAYILTSIDGNLIKPYVSAYLLLMGAVILVKALRSRHEHKEVKDHLVPLGLVGGFFDAVGGGGWGPIVTTTLVARGNHPRFAIGSVNFSEFFVTFAQSVTFLLTLGMLDTWKIIIGLLVGGVLAAPLAAIAARKLPHRILMGMVGVLIIGLSVRTIVMSLK
jgi:hypothetical protein